MCPQWVEDILWELQLPSHVIMVTLNLKQAQGLVMLWEAGTIKTRQQHATKVINFFSSYWKFNEKCSVVFEFVRKYNNIR